MKTINEEQPSFGYGCGIVLFENSIGNIEGKILTLIEALGLKENQEKSAKDIVRNIIWSVVKEDGVWIGQATHTEIRKRKESRRVIASGPFSGMVEIVE